MQLEDQDSVTRNFESTGSENRDVAGRVERDSESLSPRTRASFESEASDSVTVPRCSQAEAEAEARLSVERVIKTAQAQARHSHAAIRDRRPTPRLQGIRSFNWPPACSLSRGGWCVLCVCAALQASGRQSRAGLYLAPGRVAPSLQQAHPERVFGGGPEVRAPGRQLSIQPPLPLPASNLQDVARGCRVDLRLSRFRNARKINSERSPAEREALSGRHLHTGE